DAPCARARPAVGGILGRGQRGGGGTVGQRRGGRGGDAPAGAEGSGQVRHTRHGGARPGRFIGGGQAPAAIGIADGDGNQVRTDLAGLESGGVLALGGLGVGVGSLAGQRRVLV